MKPTLVRVFSIQDLQAVLSHRMEGYVDARDAFEGVGLDVETKGLLEAAHLKAHDGTDWVGIGHATGGKVMLDAAE